MELPAQSPTPAFPVASSGCNWLHPSASAGAVTLPTGEMWSQRSLEWVGRGLNSCQGLGVAGMALSDEHVVSREAGEDLISGCECLQSVQDLARTLNQWHLNTPGVRLDHYHSDPHSSGALYYQCGCVIHSLVGSLNMQGSPMPDTVLGPRGTKVNSMWWLA